MDQNEKQDILSNDTTEMRHGEYDCQERHFCQIGVSGHDTSRNNHDNRDKHAVLRETKAEGDRKYE